MKAVVEMKPFNLANQYTDAEKEKAVVAAVTANPDLYWQVCDVVPAEAFTQYQAEYDKLAEDVALERKPQPFDGEPSGDPLADAEHLADLHKRRLVAEVLADLGAQLKEGEDGADEIIHEAERRLSKARQSIHETATREMVSLADLYPTVLKDIQERCEAVQQHGIAAVGIPTGIKRLDALLGGLQTGLHFLAAEPGAGKTTLALQLGREAAKEGFPVVFVGFEDSIYRLALKCFCAEGNLNAKRFNDGYGDPATFDAAVKPRLGDLEMFYFEEGTSRLTIPTVKARALRAMNRHQADRVLTIFDFLQRMASARRDFSEFRHTVTALVGDLRELSNRLDSPVLAISSQNRQGQGTGNMTSLAESSSIEYTGDSLWFLMEGDGLATPPAKSVKLKVEKNRYGDIGSVDLIFRPDVGIFRQEVQE